MKVLEVENLVKKYGDKDTVVYALNEVSFSVEKGEFIAIVGKSGSGKSTLMHIVGGIDGFDKGTVKVNGKNLANLGNEELAVFRRNDIGLIYQFYNLVPILTVEENITFPMQLENKKVDKKRLNEILDMLELSDRRKHFPNELSGGQQQRVAIGRVLYSEPEIILADEPTGNLDSKNGGEVINMLSKLNEEFRKTVILITHDMNVASHAKRIITMSDGKIVEDVTNK